MMSVLIRVLSVPLLCVSALLLPMQAIAEEVPIVDGRLWLQSSDVEKRSYTIGAGIGGIAGDAELGAAVGGTAGLVVDLFGR